MIYVLRRLDKENLIPISGELMNPSIDVHERAYHYH